MQDGVRAVGSLLQHLDRLDRANRASSAAGSDNLMVRPAADVRAPPGGVG